MQHSTPYHPQGNSRVERFNGTIKRLVAKACKNHPETWYMQVNAALAAYHTAVSETTGFTPFYLLYGRRAQVPLETLLSARRDEFGNKLDDLAMASTRREPRLKAHISTTVLVYSIERMLTHRCGWGTRS